MNNNITLSALEKFSYGVEVAYRKGEPFTISDFTLIFQGTFGVTTEEGLIVSLQTDNFLVIETDKKIQVLKIGNGQLPNPPRSFSANGSNFILWTYEAPDKSTLKRSTLIITKKL